MSYSTIHLININYYHCLVLSFSHRKEKGDQKGSAKKVSFFKIYMFFYGILIKNLASGLQQPEMSLCFIMKQSNDLGQVLYPL